MYASWIFLQCAFVVIEDQHARLIALSLVQNHGISQSCLDNVLAAARVYFSLPMATKMKVWLLSYHRSCSWPSVLSLFITKLYHRSVANFKGYNPPLDSNIDPANNAKGDFHEGFEIGWEEIEAKAYGEQRANDGAMAGANVWPTDDCPAFREAYLEY